VPGQADEEPVEREREVAIGLIRAFLETREEESTSEGRRREK